MERDDELHVTEDEVRLVGHAGVTAGHLLLVAGQDTLQVLDVLVFRLLQLKQNLLVPEKIFTVLVFD